MKYAGIILIGVGIIGGVATLVGNIVQGDVLAGLLYGILFIYVTVCTGLAIIISADIPELEGKLEYSSSQIKALAADINKIKVEMVSLKRENKELKEIIIDLQNKVNDKNEVDK